MLRGIHKASSTWLGKAVMAAVMGVLVISFAIWGIGDIFRGFGQNAVAEIGGTEISIEQFRQYYNDRLQQVIRQAGRPISPDQARALGLDRQILGQLVAETTLDEQARKLPELVGGSAGRRGGGRSDDPALGVGVPGRSNARLPTPARAQGRAERRPAVARS